MEAIANELQRVLKAAILLSPTNTSLMNTIEEKYAEHPSQMNRGMNTDHHDINAVCSAFTASKIEKTNNETTCSHNSNTVIPSQVVTSLIVSIMIYKSVEMVFCMSCFRLLSSSAIFFLRQQCVDDDGIFLRLITGNPTKAKI